MSWGKIIPVQACEYINYYSRDGSVIEQMEHAGKQFTI
jgi:hypothetical protein